MEAYLGVDVGSMSTKFALLDEDRRLMTKIYLLTQGKPIEMMQQGLKQIKHCLDNGVHIAGVGTTGSARYLAGTLLGADLIKNEITSHAIATLQSYPEVKTIIEIGGQDSKIIIIRDGVVTDFGMNTVCAAGTGSFLDHQALRLNMSITEFSERALSYRSPASIAGRCTVFAESDMIHKQQSGHSIEDILFGLCQALARNYINNVGLGKDIKPPVVFQGGVALNRAMVRAFEEALETEIIVSQNCEIVGAIGAAILAQEHIIQTGQSSSFRGFDVSEGKYKTSSFECKSCPNLCEIIQLHSDGSILARWGGRCDRWDVMRDELTHSLESSPFTKS